MKCHPNGAGTLRPSPKKVQKKNQPPAEWQKDQGKTIVVPVEFSTDDHAATLEAARAAGHASVGEYILHLIAAERGSKGGA